MTQAALPKLYLEVAVPLPLNGTFSYALPERFSDVVRVGMRVLVPFGRRLLTGYAVGLTDEIPAQQDLKPIADVLDTEPLFTEADLQFYKWAASYYQYPLGLAIKTGLPAGLQIEYVDGVSLTSSGRQAFESGCFPAACLPVARLLAPAKSLTVKTVMKATGGQGGTWALRLLEEQGFIETLRRKKRASVGIKTEKWFSPAEGAGAGSLKGRQRELYLLIAAGAPVSLSSLRLQAGPCTPQLAALEKKGLIAASLRECLRKPADGSAVFVEPVHTPTAEQQRVIDSVSGPVQQRIFYPVLLHGITGSGKTEIYLHIMARVLEQKRQSLYLVPEIALTAQLYDRISSRLQAPIAMLHSSLSDAERYDAWRMIRRGQVQVVVGARSAIFASFQDLGAIIVDEEHDGSYKQDDGLRYNARDLALVKARNAGCLVMLGSATPSLETYSNAASGKYHLAELESRIEDRQLPAVRLIDMRIETAARGKRAAIISGPLQKALGLRLARGEQSLLFLNRRGFAPVYLCSQCGHTFSCPNCSVSLIHHLSRRSLTCHYCDYRTGLPGQCPSCGGFFLDSKGWGTERLEAELQLLFPQARLSRMDRDTTARRGATREILRLVHQGETDILIGTQMIVKGYHLPGVTLVGVVSADQSLSMPDYRSAERTFQLLTQVGGRSGRGELPGEVIIQTYNPDHYSIACAARHDFKSFYKKELRFRRELSYPPFTKIVNLRFEGARDSEVARVAQLIGQGCRQQGNALRSPQGIEILGPAKAPWEKIKNRYRYQLLLKGPAAGDLKACAARALQEHAPAIKKSGVKVSIDVDPMLMM